MANEDMSRYLWKGLDLKRYHKLRRINHYRGHAVWLDNLEDGEPVHLFGYPIYVCKAMDDVVPGG